MPSTYKPRFLKDGPNTDITYNCCYITRIILCTGLYFALSPYILSINDYVPEYDTNSDLYKAWYYRVVVDTQYFPVA